GSTDAHTGIMSIEEDNFFGKTTPQEPSPHRMTAAFMNNQKTGVKIMDWEVCSAGYAAVWAEENTRASLWDAMQRKETYATTGSKDPDFDAKQRAFYYVRVLEIPTPRWTAYDVKRFGVKPLPGTRMTITERAYTSPIWFNPAK